MNEIQIKSSDLRAKKHFEKFCRENPEYGLVEKNQYEGAMVNDLVLVIQEVPDILDSLALLIAALKADKIKFSEIVDRFKTDNGE